MVVLLAGLAGLLLSGLHWAALGLGFLDYTETLRAFVASLTAMSVGIQLFLSGFLSGILDLSRIERREGISSILATFAKKLPWGLGLRG